MKYWNFDDWVLFGIVVFGVLVVLGVALPLLVGMAKVAWMWVLGLS